ncbi:MAG: hypothetical protein ABSA57_10820 [Candidatus Acidiferrales bacterium]|jgi:hypothetical protein
MLRKLCLLVLFGLMCGALAPARAQDPSDKIELSGEYAYMHFKSSPSVNLNGLDFSGQYKLRNWLGVAADLGGELGNVGGVNSRLYTYLFGPQVCWPRGRISPFAHVLVGAAYFTGGGYASKSLASGFGLGVDAKIKARWSWRIIEADIIQTRVGGLAEHNTRIGTGIIYRF